MTEKPLVLITGAAGIIGPAIAKALCANGWRVIATDQSQENFELYQKAFGVPIEADEIIAANLGSQRECMSLINRIESTHGSLYAIINGAAINQSPPFSAITEADTVRHFSVNAFAPIFLAQAARSSLCKNFGSIINLSSVLVDEVQDGGLLYACSKVSLERATKAMAFELWNDGIRVNCLRIGRVPGYAFIRKTIKDLPVDYARRMVREILAEYVNDLERQHGRQAVGRPEDIANAIVFLLSAEARFVNGQTLVIDGGFRPGVRQAEAPAQSISLEQRISRWSAQHSLSGVL